MDVPALDVRFLRPSARGKFSKSMETFERAYGQVLECLKTPADLAYVPTVYAFPFVLVKEQRLDAERFLVLRFLSVTSVDPHDLDRLGIYISTYAAELDYEDIASCLATEIAHFAYLKGEVKVDPRLLPTHPSEDDLGVNDEQEKDQAVAQERALYNEPVHGWLENFDAKMKTGEPINKIKENANTMQFTNFLEAALGEKYAELKAKQLEKLKSKLQQK